MLLTGLFWNEDGGIKPFTYCWLSRISQISPWTVLSCWYWFTVATSDITSRIHDPRLDLSCSLLYLHCHFYHASLMLVKKCVQETIFPTHWEMGSVVSLVWENAFKYIKVAPLQVMIDRTFLPPVGIENKHNPSVPGEKRYVLACYYSRSLKECKLTTVNHH